MARRRFDEAINLLGQFVQRQNFSRQAGPGNRSGHPPDNAGGFILGQHSSASFADMFATTKSVLAHSREHDGQRVRTIDFCNRIKERVYRRSA